MNPEPGTLNEFLWGEESMMLVSLAALVAALGVVVLVVVLVPAINEMKKTIVALREFIVNTESSLNPLLGEQIGRSHV